MSIKYNKKEEKLKSSLSRDLGLDMRFTTLDLKSLGISDINEIEGLNEIPNFQVLDLSNNNISEIKGLENLTSLL